MHAVIGNLSAECPFAIRVRRLFCHSHADLGRKVGPVNIVCGVSLYLFHLSCMALVVGAGGTKPHRQHLLLTTLAISIPTLPSYPFQGHRQSSTDFKEGWSSAHVLKDGMNPAGRRDEG